MNAPELARDTVRSQGDPGLDLASMQGSRGSWEIQPINVQERAQLYLQILCGVNDFHWFSVPRVMRSKRPGSVNAWRL